MRALKNNAPFWNTSMTSPNNQAISQGKLTKIFKRNLRSIFKFLDWLVPKDKRLIIFTQQDSLYSDNAKALYEHICNDPNSQWRAVWLYQGKPQRPVSDNYVAFHSLKGFWLALRAQFFTMLTSSLNRVFAHYRPSRRTKFICLWHGIPIKAIRYFEPRLAKRQRALRKLTNQISLLICSSKQDRLAMSCAFQLSPQKTVITGLPRSDNFFKPRKPGINLEALATALNSKTILYAPTYRECPKTQEATEFFPFHNFNPKDLVECLKQEDAHLLLRPHPGDENVITQLQKLVDLGQGHIHLALPTVLRDINELLPFVDVVITDYSSTYIDLLLTNTPCIFIPYDFENYSKTRTLIYDYDLVTPGPKVSTHQEFIAALNSALHGAPDYQLDRDRVKKMFHQYSDGNACQRVLDAMEILV